VIFQADRELREEARRFGQEVKAARTRLGLTQADVARASTVATSVISSAEAGDPTVSLWVRFRIAVLLGLRLRLPVYSDGTPFLYDAAHTRIVDRLLAIRHSRWSATLEAPVPGPGRRSTDVRMEAGQDIVLFEVESHVTRWEEVVREGESKRAAVRLEARPGMRVHSVLVLPPTVHHRDLVTSFGRAISTAYPVSSHSLSRALQRDADKWPGDGILWIAGSR
jgi:transcriptional regulator with XRE-family HTH domain